ncbi:hypothetical protein DNL40_09250 [Xylanimonas oleitrophica]|uniref:NAD-dependent epimerase/dehydratase domain-containing protein n=1 Tax=Xylanimonas oleitrophica TaxID=2607479 RepID=A0A2W5WP56_9MICO|nr:NAD-dependent epimerase/dehydratase family protein [Xylanimonas oleitrophica]PZR53167.1 hypothetical protein DNL40_09250 [Xylanimonas oleitrophica]
MKVFITGGTGYLGSVVVQHLVAGGHEVSALARSHQSARRLTRAGAVPIRGSLADTRLLADAAADADAVIHAAVDYSMTDEAAQTELAAVTALVAGAGTARTGKPVIYTSTGLVYGFDPDHDASEDATLPQVSAQPVKVAAERVVLGAAGITSIVVRAGLLFGRGGSSMITGLIDHATTNGRSIYVDEGDNTWLPLHVDDLARLYTRALCHPVAGVFNAAGEVRFSFRGLAEAVGQLTATPAVSVPLAAAEQAFGPAARVLTTTSRLSSSKARSAFGWAPSDRSLIEEILVGSYRDLRDSVA